MKIFYSPIHYVYDNEKLGSEFSWAYNIVNRISSIEEVEGVVGKSLLRVNKKNIKECWNNADTAMGALDAVIFSFKYNYATFRKLLNTKFDIHHHLLPFHLGRTFNLGFFQSLKNKRVIGPIQSPLKYYDSANIGKKFSFSSLLIEVINPVLKILSRFTLRRANKLVVINDYTKGLVIKEGIDPEKIMVIPPGVDSRTFQGVGYDVKPEKLNIISVGYLLKRKGLDNVILGFNKAFKQNSNMHLTIVGDGPEYKLLNRLASDLGLIEAITFKGFIPNKEINKEYSRSHILVNMSRSEGFATICLEAMSSGLAILSSKVGGFNEAVYNNINGYLVDQNDYEKLGDYILSLAENKELLKKMMISSREIVMRDYDWDTVIIPKYMNLYNSLLKK